MYLRAGLAILGLAVLSCMLMACAAQQLPPALPEDRFPYYDDSPGLPSAEQLHWPPPSVLTVPDQEPLPSQAMLPQRIPLEVLEAIPTGRTGKAIPVKPIRLEPPEKVLERANRDALVTPSTTGFFGGMAEQRYVYQPGKIYLVISARNHPTTIILPPGETLAAQPVINQCQEREVEPSPAQAQSQTQDDCWVVGAAVMGKGEARREVIVLRPFRAGLEATMPLLTRSGRAYYVRLKSQDALGMISVTWELGSAMAMGEASGEAQALRLPARPQDPGGLPKAPAIGLERLHTGYTIATTSKYAPPWVPVQVLDDGSKTFIEFKEDLGYTKAPTVYAVQPDRSDAAVDFTAHLVQGRHVYAVQGLHPRLVLKGEAYEVTITRGPTRHAR